MLEVFVVDGEDTRDVGTYNIASGDFFEKHELDSPDRHL